MRSSAKFPFFILALWQPKWVYGLWVVLLVILGVMGTVLLTQDKLKPLTLGSYQSYQCRTGAVDKEKPVYRILTVLHKRAEELANTLCQSDVMREYYSGVDIQWMKRSQLSARQIVEEDFDLLWGRNRQAQGLVPNFSQYYQPLLHLPDYKVFWFSLNENPQANADYFRGKHIGLLEDMQSNSHFLLPLNHLKSLGVSLSDVKITYYTNYFMLEDAFWRGDIDLMSDGHWLPESSDGKTLYRELIDGNSSMGNWYVRVNRHVQTDCRVLAALKEFSTTLANIDPDSIRSSSQAVENIGETAGANRADGFDGECQ